MCKKPLISVCVPAYNHENYVQKTIQSIIDQTYENIELIVIDDGSKDTTWQKINDMREVCEKRFKNVIFKTKPNGGTCETLNMLIELANGEYISLSASDDAYKPTAIEDEYDFLSQNPDYVLAVGDNELIDENSKVCYWDKDRNNVYDIKKAKYKTFGDFLKNARKDINFNSENFGSYQSLYIGNYIPNGYLIRRSIFDKTGFFTKDAPLEDYWFMLQASKYGKFKYIDKVLYSYRWHNSNTIKNNDKMMRYDRMTREHEEKILQNLDSKIVFPEVKEIKEYGVLLKRQGIPFFIEIQKRKKIAHKIKILKIFNIDVKKWIKK